MCELRFLSFGPVLSRWTETCARSPLIIALWRARGKGLIVETV